MVLGRKNFFRFFPLGLLSAQGLFLIQNFAKNACKYLKWPTIGFISKDVVRLVF